MNKENPSRFAFFVVGHGRRQLMVVCNDTPPNGRQQSCRSGFRLHSVVSVLHALGAYHEPYGLAEKRPLDRRHPRLAAKVAHKIGE
jgi:hypothetical protein